MTAKYLLAAFCALTLIGCQTAPTKPNGSTSDTSVLGKLKFENTPEGARAILDESILFPSGKATFEKTADPVLDILQPAFDKARGKIVIEGHTDSTGSVQTNQQLSTARAQAVRDALIQRRINPNRLEVRGLAATKPRKFPETNDEDRRTNRRAEFLFVGSTVTEIQGQQIESQVNAKLSEIWGSLKEYSSGVLQRLSEIGGKK
jgi:outer membrane protein OmpA-like peptidoglycan-associated protein